MDANSLHTLLEEKGNPEWCQEHPALFLCILDHSSRISELEKFPGWVSLNFYTLKGGVKNYSDEKLVWGGEVR
jgi:hypothetical protein